MPGATGSGFIVISESVVSWTRPMTTSADHGGEMEEPMTTAAETPAQPGRPITFTVDDEPVSTTEEQLTPNQILGLAGIDPATSYLVRITGRHQESYQGRGDEPIRVHQNEVFVSVSTGPTPTS
jgi:hypothetical protein